MYDPDVGFENGKLVRVTLRAVDTNGDEQVNTFHYDLIDDITGSNSPQDLADRFRDDVRPAWIAHYRPNWTLDPVVVTEEKDPQNPSAPRSSWTSGDPAVGTRSTSGDILPRKMCAIATLRTDHIGRRYRGRNFIGGSNTEDNLTAGIWGDTYLAYLQAMIDNVPFEPDLATGDPLGVSAHWCVYSRTARALDQDPYASHITSATVRPEPHWLRRR